MGNILTIFLLIAILPAREIYQQVRVFADTPHTILSLQEAGLDLDHSYRDPEGEWIEFSISANHIHLLDKTHLNYDIIHEDLESFYASRLKDHTYKKDKDYESREFDLGSMGGYYTFAEIEEHLDELYLYYPDLIAEKVSLGQTLEGRDIWMNYMGTILH